MKKTAYLLLIMGFISVVSSKVAAQSSGTDKSSSNSSSSNNRFFKAFGFCPILGFSVSPERIYTDYSLSYNIEGGYFMYDMFDFVFALRYNLAEFNNNSSLSVGSDPDLGFSAGAGVSSSFLGVGFLSINIPVFLEYNMGNIATYNADQDKGFVIGAGVEFTDAPLIALNEGSYTDASGSIHNITVPTTWIEPAVEIGYRHWNKSNKAKEINLKLGYGGGGSFTFRLSWIKYIGY